ncbi:TSUP family transporter [Halorubrum sp. CBA1125]|uniref:sulfite exporter TauE/SafE family protein n=1 Tax=Halorubrum sp. CBA1125 TaxID=2668072 RepID=UPI0012E7E2B8|nr:sulfite exporter TauE/SafE family protein [Halorubrum sp. CBA1125]MUW15144.1 TSUP family transporter [Halorubrum sp. CBA1125]
MVLALSGGSIAAIAAVVAVAGAVNGIAGFGFAVVGTMALATLLDPATAVAFMILPMFGVNLALVGDLSREELQTCGRRFAPLLLAALVGTLLGTALLGRFPAGPLRGLLGLVALGFVATTQRIVPVPALSRATDRCFVETPFAMAGVGIVSGLLFGATNVGVQLVAFVRSCDLSHGLFVGVVALVFVGINGLRIAAAGAFGLYSDLGLVLASLAAAVPAVAGVAAGKRLRGRVSEQIRRGLVLGLLSGIGVRLVLGGAEASEPVVAGSRWQTRSRTGSRTSRVTRSAPRT